LLAWQEFLPGKRNKQDVQVFSLHLMDNIIALHEDLKNKIYQHGGYEDFYVNDPKRRHIHKASVRDRLLHHAVYRQLYPFFDKTFIADSFSCRKNKGTHKALDRFTTVARQVNKNNTKTCRILKCDIKQFFASIDHEILLNILKERILDRDVFRLLEKIIGSFSSCHPRPDRGSMDSRLRLPADLPAGRQGRQDRQGGNDNIRNCGLPLGNLTSQLFANAYLNTFDQFIKHQLKIKHYLRYADDFVILSSSERYLQSLVFPVQSFLLNKLKLILHPNKIYLQTLSSGVDWLGWINFPYYRKLRPKTKQRMFERAVLYPQPAVFQSYVGLLSHGNTYKISKDLSNLFCAVGEKESNSELDLDSPYFF